MFIYKKFAERDVKIAEKIRSILISLIIPINNIMLTHISIIITLL